MFFRSNFCRYRSVVMFLVEESQRNIFDQRYIENELWKRWVLTGVYTPVTVHSAVHLNFNGMSISLYELDKNWVSELLIRPLPAFLFLFQKHSHSKKAVQ